MRRASRAILRVLVVLAALTSACSDDSNGEGAVDAGADAASVDAEGTTSDVDQTGDDAAADVMGDECVSYTDCADKDGFKTAGQCFLVTCDFGTCALVAKADGIKCDDGDKCTASDRCVSGKCGSAKKTDCDDSDLCTDDDCDEDSGCYHLHAPNGTGCDDGHKCTHNDKCTAGGCFGKALACDDDNGCTIDKCTPSKGCVHGALAGNCDDGDDCTDYDSCDKGVCSGLPKSMASCDDNDPCTADGCVKGIGCINEKAGKDGAPCADSNPCTFGETCIKGTCTPKGSSTCECTKNADCAKHEDGDKCNGTFTCDTSALPFACTLDSATIVKCSGTSLNPCTAPQCDKQTGICVYLPKPDGSFCDADGSKCTTPDRCLGPICVTGPKLKCDDGNACTVDLCDAKKGCYSKLPKQDGRPCDADGDACTVGDTCQAGVCLPGKATVCDDDNACTKDLCDKKTGACSPQLTAFNGNACTAQNDKCSAAAICKQGVCLTTKTKTCDDGKQCTEDLCHGVHGCLFVVKKQSTPCDADNNKCTVGDVCSGGTCLPGQATTCDDSNGCTLDKCDPKDGLCGHSVLEMHGLNCNDGNACTKLENCNLGTCKGGKDVVCDDGDPCTKDACDMASGCTITGGPLVCEDGNLCTGPDVCKKGTCTTGPKILCNDGNECTDDSCDKQLGCVFEEAERPCNAGGVHGLCYEKACVKDTKVPCGLFEKRIRPTGLESGWGVAAFNDGAMLTGFNAVPSQPGGGRGWVARISHFGDKLWHRQYDGTRQLYSVILGAGNTAITSGNTAACQGIVLGVTLSSGATKVQATHKSFTTVRNVLFTSGATAAAGWGKGAKTDTDAVVGVVDTKSKWKWVRRFDRPGFDYGFGVASLRAGHFALVGVRGGAKALRQGYCDNAMAAELSGVAFATGLSASGEVAWDRTFPPPAGSTDTFTAGFAAARVSAGGIAIGGATGKKGSKTWRIWVARIGQKGREMWRRTYARGYATSLVERSVGGLAIVGGQNVAGFPGSPLIITDPVGSLRKSRSYSNGGLAAFGQVANAGNHGLWAAGVTNVNPNHFFDAFVLRTDPWGQVHCGKSGKCAAIQDACADGNPCTVDDCFFKTGCVNTKIPACISGHDTDNDGTYDETHDLDHDGVCESKTCHTNAVDTCPHTWNPDNDPKACPALPSGFSPSMPLQMKQVGLHFSHSSERRTHDLVEVPIVTGLLNASVIARLPLRGTGKDEGPLKLSVKSTAVKPAVSMLGAPSGAVDLAAKANVTVSKIPGKRLDQATIALRVRPTTHVGGEIARLDGGSGTVVRLWMQGGALRCSYRDNAGKNSAITATAVEHRLRLNTWRHVGCTIGAGKLSVYVDGLLAASLPSKAAPAATDATTFIVGSSGGGDAMAGRFEDAVLLNRALHPEDIRAWSVSRARFGDKLIPAVQDDFDDLRVSVTSRYAKLPVQVVTDIAGMARYSDSAPGTVRHWPLAGHAVDAGPIGKVGKAVGSKVARGPFGSLQGALSFAGAGHVDTGAKWSADTDEPFGIRLWVRAKSGTSGALVGARNESGSGIELALLNKSQGAGKPAGVRFAMTDDAGNSVTAVAPGAWTDERWHHIAVLRKTGAKKSLHVYVDGFERSVITDTTAKAVTIGVNNPLYLAAVNQAGKAANGMTGELSDVVLTDGKGGVATVVRGATRLPRIRFLASTSAYASKSGTWAYLRYRIHFGQKKAKMVPARRVALDGKTTCDGLVNACLGVAGWWRMRRDATGHTPDITQARRQASVGAGIATIVGREELAFAAGFPAALRINQPGFDADKPFTLEVGLRNDVGSNGVALSQFSGKRGLRWITVPAGLALTMSDGTNTIAPVVKLSEGRWYDIALSRSHHTATARLNGKTVATASTEKLGVVDAETALDVGRSHDGFKGAIDEVRISTRELASDELIIHPRTQVLLGCDKHADCPSAGPCATAKCNPPGRCEYDAKPNCKP